MERWSGESNRGKIFVYFFSIRQIRARIEETKGKQLKARREREGSHRSSVSKNKRIPLSPGGLPG